MKALHVYIGLVLVTFGISCFLIKAEFNIRHLEKEIYELKIECHNNILRDESLLDRIRDVEYFNTFVKPRLCTNEVNRSIHSQTLLERDK